LPESDKISIGTFNQNGRMVQQILSAQERTAGTHQVLLNRAQLSSGLYYVVLQSTKERLTQKMVLLQN